MKNSISFVVISALLTGCASNNAIKPEPTINQSETPFNGVIVNYIQDRNGVAYLPNQEQPFTGRYEAYYPNGQKKSKLITKMVNVMVYLCLGMKMGNYTLVVKMG